MFRFDDLPSHCAAIISNPLSVGCESSDETATRARMLDCSTARVTSRCVASSPRLATIDESSGVVDQAASGRGRRNV